MARLGVDGQIVQIAGPQEENPEDIWNGPNRKISFGIFEVTWGKGIPRERYAAPSTGYFDRNKETDLEDMERARMKVTRVCVYIMLITMPPQNLTPLQVRFSHTCFLNAYVTK